MFFKIRQGVLEVIEDVTNKDLEGAGSLEVTTTSMLWKKILARDISAEDAVKSGELLCKPGVDALTLFMENFDIDSKISG